jgi:hypothetical protein
VFGLGLVVPYAVFVIAVPFVNPNAAQLEVDTFHLTRSLLNVPQDPPAGVVKKLNALVGTVLYNVKVS